MSLLPSTVSKPSCVVAGEVVQIVGVAPTVILVAMGLGSANFDLAGFLGSIQSLRGAAFLFGLLPFPVFAYVLGQNVKRRHAWARYLSIVLCSVAMLLFPIGTAFGGYAIYHLTVRWAE